MTGDSLIRVSCAIAPVFNGLDDAIDLDACSNYTIVLTFLKTLQMKTC